MKKFIEIACAFLLIATIGGTTVSAQTIGVADLTLIDATSNQPVAGYDPIPADATLNIRELPAKLAIRANTSPATVGSVRFGLNGTANFRIENEAPYSLTGDKEGQYYVWDPALGAHTVTAVAFTQDKSGGEASAPYILNFTLVDTAAGTATPTPVATAPASDPDPDPDPNPNPDPDPDPSTSGAVSGELRKWHKVTLSFEGPQASETGSPNPFLDYRLNVTFVHPDSGKSHVVPGYFAADGNAANSSATAGNVWRVHFAPDEVGTWNYKVSLRSGSQVAVSTAADAGTAGGYMDGATGSFVIAPTNKSGRDLRGKGLLQYVGEHYLRFAETGEFFIKGGADSPENFLAYEDFDNTPNEDDLRKSWSAHAKDYQNDGPTWQNGKGSEIVGAINYLAAKGVNAFSFLTLNTQGDDKNVFPYVTPSGAGTPNGSYVADRTQFDVSKLAQWGLVFDHATHKGMYLHFKLQETENDGLLDDGDLGVERKLYYRELIARFGHNLALNWNISEEFNPGNEAARLAAYVAYFKAVDPYHHPVVVHTYPGDQTHVYGGVIEQKILTGVSLQVDWDDVYATTKKWREESALAAKNSGGQKWVVANDEQGSSSHGVPPDAGCRGAPEQGSIRHRTLWGNLMAGGAGVEYYFGYNCTCSDLTCQDYRSRDAMWGYTQHALAFFSRYIPFWEMVSDNALSTANNDYVLAKPGEFYALYLPAGGTTEVKLVSGRYDVRWYDPRTGGELQKGSVDAVDGSAATSIGQPPSSPSADWVVLIQKHGIPFATATPKTAATSEATPTSSESPDLGTPTPTTPMASTTPEPGAPSPSATPIPGASPAPSLTPGAGSPDLPPAAEHDTQLFLPAIAP